MYGSTPQDLWCSTKRQIILDPSNMKPISNDDYMKNRVNYEINFYKPDYIMIDISDNIYDRSGHKLSDILHNYSKYDLSLILSDIINGYYLYKINY